jgi:uncharacterized protein (TIGR02145 family)
MSNIRLVLLVAVSFIISCSGNDGLNGKDGVDGANGIDGKNGKDLECIIWPKLGGEGGYDVICDNEKVGEIFDGIDGIDGIDGNNGKKTDCIFWPKLNVAYGYDVICDNEKIGEISSCYKEEDGDYFVMKCNGIETSRWAKAICGISAYDPATLSCCGANIYDPITSACCGANVYNIATSSCCGTSVYDSTMQFCNIFDGQAYNFCGGNSYDPTKQFCQNNLIYDLCGNNFYDPTKQFCNMSDGQAYNLCGNNFYDPTKKFCQNNLIYDLCGNNFYDPTKKFCQNNLIYDLCGSNSYDPTKQFCQNNLLYDLCGNNFYDPTKQICDNREGKMYRYVQIGEQYWLAENMNYNTSGSLCYDNNLDYCTQYGRLYDWATAIGIPSDCNRFSCASLINAKHRGICPSGWHIPSDAEWTILMYFIDNDVGRKLKATYDWNGNGIGTDDYGFSALPSGWLDVDFYDLGYYGYWWSTTEEPKWEVGYAYARHVHYDSNDLHGAPYVGGAPGRSKGSSFSVRCVRN